MTKKFFNPYPKYLQIREMLVRRIEQELNIGDQIPTESRLCEEFGVSRETIREALSGLEADGLISRRRGQGTFVAKRAEAPAERRLTGLTEDFSELRMNTDAQVLEKGPVHASHNVAATLQPTPTEMIYRIVRLRSYEGDPFAYHEAFMPLETGARIGKLDLSKTSIVYELRETLGLSIWEDYQRVEAQVADMTLAELLQVSMGAPLLYVSRHFLDDADESVVLFRSYYRADRYYYSVKLSTDRDDARKS